MRLVGWGWWGYGTGSQEFPRGSAYLLYDSRSGRCSSSCRRRGSRGHYSSNIFLYFLRHINHRGVDAVGCFVSYYWGCHTCIRPIILVEGLQYLHDFPQYISQFLPLNPIPLCIRHGLLRSGGINELLSYGPVIVIRATRLCLQEVLKFLLRQPLNRHFVRDY